MPKALPVFLSVVRVVEIVESPLIKTMGHLDAHDSDLLCSCLVVGDVWLS